MANKPHNVRLNQYFFPETHVRALESHDPAGTRTGTVHSISFHVDVVPTKKMQHGVSVIFETDDEGGNNPPYSFRIVAYGLFEPESAETEDLIGDYQNNLEAVAIQVLFGAIREHLAAITARSPWSTFVAGAAHIQRRKDDCVASDAPEDQP